MRSSFSPLRQDIFEKVKKSDSPLSAGEIFKKLRKKTAFSTVYRALWYLEEQGLVCGFSISCGPCGKDRFFVDASRGHVHYFHCEKCHRFIEIAECAVNAAVIEKKYGIAVKNHSVFYSGVCRECR